MLVSKSHECDSKYQVLTQRTKVDTLGAGSSNQEARQGDGINVERKTSGTVSQCVNYSSQWRVSTHGRGFDVMRLCPGAVIGVDKTDYIQLCVS